MDKGLAQLLIHCLWFYLGCFMNKKLLSLFLLIAIAFLAGCAATRAVQQKPVIIDDPVVDNGEVLYRNQAWDGNQGIEVECKSASSLGCRHKGRVYPWNAWLEVKGYAAKDYDMKEVIQHGSRATVVIMQR